MRLARSSSQILLVICSQKHFRHVTSLLLPKSTLLGLLGRKSSNKKKQSPQDLDALLHSPVRRPSARPRTQCPSRPRFTRCFSQHGRSGGAPCSFCMCGGKLPVLMQSILLPLYASMSCVRADETRNTEPSRVKSDFKPQPAARSGEQTGDRGVWIKRSLLLLLSDVTPL